MQKPTATNQTDSMGILGMIFGISKLGPNYTRSCGTINKLLHIPNRLVWDHKKRKMTQIYFVDLENFKF